MADFKVLRGTSVIGSADTTLTLTEGTDFTLETGIASDAWFFRLTNSNHTGQGNTSGGGTRRADEQTVHFTYSGDEVVLTRANSVGNDCRVTWEIVQYIGASGGANEIKVRDKGTLSLTSGNTLSTLAVPGSVGTAANCVAWVCAQSSSHNNATRHQSALYTSRLNGSNFEFQRGAGSGTGTVSYALVEFTGSNWTIQNVQFTQTGSDGTASLGTNVSALSEAFLHNTYRFDNTGNGGLDDCSVLVYLSAVGTLTYDTTTSSDATDKHHSIWVIENPDLNVQRLDFTMAGAGEEEVDTETITAVSDLEQTMLTVDNNSTGSGTAMPRGYIDARLTSTTEVRFSQTDNGQTSRVVAEIIELPTAAGGPAAQTIVGSALADPGAIGAGIVSPGAVSVSGAAFSDPDVFGSGLIGAHSAISGAVYADPDALGSGSVGVGSVTIAGAALTDSDAFGVGSVSQGAGPQTIVGAAYPDGDVVGSGSVGLGPVTIAGAALTDVDAFGAGSISQGAGPQTIVGAGHVDGDSVGAGALGAIFTIIGQSQLDPDTFGSGVLDVGTLDQFIAGASHANADAFGSGGVSSTVSISGQAHSDGDILGFGALSVGGVTIIGARYVDAETFGDGQVASGSTAITGSAFADSDQFGGGAVTPGPVQVNGQAYLDQDVFFAGSIEVGQVQIAGAAFMDIDGFGSGFVILAGLRTFRARAASDRNSDKLAEPRPASLGTIRTVRIAGV